MGYNWDYLNKEGYNNNTGHYRSKIELDFIGKKHSEQKIQDTGHCRRIGKNIDTAAEICR